jgi:hypothetical protein
MLELASFARIEFCTSVFCGRGCAMVETGARKHVEAKAGGVE